MALFGDAAAWRESSQWKAVFATPGMEDSNAQLFTNFGSVQDVDVATDDLDTFVTKVSEQFAMDVYAELKTDINQAQQRASKTAHGGRETGKRSVAPQRTPVITPNNSRRMRVGAGGRPAP